MTLDQAFTLASQVGGKFSVETHGRGIWLATFTRVGADGIPAEYRGVGESPADSIENAAALLNRLAPEEGPPPAEPAEWARVITDRFSKTI